VNCRGYSHDTLKENDLFIAVFDDDRRTFREKVDEIDGAQLAMLAMFLECIMSCAKDSCVLVGVVLVMKEACTDLAEQQAAEHSCCQKFCMEPRFQGCKCTPSNFTSAHR
jgi:hypothetical protein